MTDLEMTKLCAEAMELTVLAEDRFRESGLWVADVGRNFFYRPCASDTVGDAQAMQLVKRFDLSFCPRRYDEHGRHRVILHQGEGVNYACYIAEHEDLNHAIVECVSKMAKAGQAQTEAVVELGR